MSQESRLGVLEPLEINISNDILERESHPIFKLPSKTMVITNYQEKNLDKRFYFAIKRIIDIICSLCALVVLSPFFLIIAIAIKLDSKGPVFFIHERVGRYGKKFSLYKFRSMVYNAEELTNSFTLSQKAEFESNYKLDKDPRITKVGAVLRRTSLDELPQLLNILQGNLSIVGPRPVVEKELEKYKENKAVFLNVKPGLTGYWQVNGRSAITYNDRIKLELYYSNHCCFKLDMRIVFKTIIVVLRQRGAK